MSPPIPIDSSHLLHHFCQNTVYRSQFVPAFKHCEVLQFYKARVSLLKTYWSHSPNAYFSWVRTRHQQRIRLNEFQTRNFFVVPKKSCLELCQLEVSNRNHPVARATRNQSKHGAESNATYVAPFVPSHHCPQTRGYFRIRFIINIDFWVPGTGDQELVIRTELQSRYLFVLFFLIFLNGHRIVFYASLPNHFHDRPIRVVINSHASAIVSDVELPVSVIKCERSKFRTRFRVEHLGVHFFEFPANCVVDPYVVFGADDEVQVVSVEASIDGHHVFVDVFQIFILDSFESQKASPCNYKPLSFGHGDQLRHFKLSPFFGNYLSADLLPHISDSYVSSLIHWNCHGFPLEELARDYRVIMAFELPLVVL